MDQHRVLSNRKSIRTSFERIYSKNLKRQIRNHLRGDGAALTAGSLERELERVQAFLSRPEQILSALRGERIDDMTVWKIEGVRVLELPFDWLRRLWSFFRKRSLNDPVDVRNWPAFVCSCERTRHSWKFYWGRDVGIIVIVRCYETDRLGNLRFFRRRPGS